MLEDLVASDNTGGEENEEEEMTWQNDDVPGRPSAPTKTSTSDGPATVSDTYWYNGNLNSAPSSSSSSGAYVTRWTGGMKVAEPLRKYDPVAAEELLFRQPAKWLVRNVRIAGALV